jgi:hypothetical protein
LISTTTEARRLIDDLDLIYPVNEARDHSPGIDIAAAERCYRDFLYVCWFAASRGNAPGRRLAVICECADTVWHEHILVTPAYRADCATIFGLSAYLDHVPSDYYGVEVTAADRAASAALYTAAGVTPCDAPRAKCVWCQT